MQVVGGSDQAYPSLKVAFKKPACKQGQVKPASEPASGLSENGILPADKVVSWHCTTGGEWQSFVQELQRKRDDRRAQVVVQYVVSEPRKAIRSIRPRCKIWCCPRQTSWPCPRAGGLNGGVHDGDCHQPLASLSHASTREVSHRIPSFPNRIRPLGNDVDAILTLSLCVPSRQPARQDFEIDISCAQW